MTRTCTVCGHPERQAIDTALVAGGAYRDIAGRYGLTKSAVERHQAEHLPAAMVRGEAAVVGGGGVCYWHVGDRRRIMSAAINDHIRRRAVRAAGAG